MNAAAFINSIVGLPWQEGAQGPCAYDCWGLARSTQRELFGRDLPLLACAAGPSQVNRDNIRDVIRAMDSVELRGEWVRADRPQHGDIAMISHRKYPSHMGTFLRLDGGGILHVTREGGVRFEPITLLRLGGWARISFFRPHAAPPGVVTSEAEETQAKLGVYTAAKAET